MEGTDFFGLVDSLAEKTGSKYADRQACRIQLYEFLEGNGWFGQKGCPPADGEAVILRNKQWLLASEDAAALEPHLCLWLAAYQRSNREKLEILAGHGMRLWPGTTACYMKFIHQGRLEDGPAAWQLLDYLLASIGQEINGCTAEEMERLAAQMDRELPLVTAQLFSKFLEYMADEGQANGWVYRFSGRTKRAEGTNDAYTVSEFSVMAYCTFHEDAWAENHLLEKACDSAVYANLWAFVAMHFVCALRGTDIERLPLFALPCDGEELRRRLLEGSFGRAAPLIKDLQLRLRYKPMKPQKTAGYGNMPELKLFVPQSLEEPLGIILAVAASHCKDTRTGEGFLKISRKAAHTRKFFGDAFAKALNGRDFSSRKANKAYLQGIGAAAGTDAPKGYMLAALARSHKRGIGTLPDTTAIYLRDAKFSGYSPEFIAREMFERGVFGFVPCLLLEACAGKEYTELPVKAQTEMITLLGIPASGLEGLVRLNDTALIRARALLAEVFSGRQDIPAVLQKIAAGNAVGKQEGFFCLMAASGFPCRHPERAGCFGCRYEIYTKAALHLAVSEYARLQSLRKQEKDGWRYQLIIRETILPAITEMLGTVKLLYPQADMDSLTEIMEGGLSGYVSGNQPGG